MKLLWPHENLCVTYDRCLLDLVLGVILLCVHLTTNSNSGGIIINED